MEEIENKQKCRICGQEFDHSLLEDHIAKFHENIICDICQKVFNCKQNMEKHVSFVHGRIGKEYICNICTKYFQTKGNLTFHRKALHGGGKYHKCESCGKSFSAARTLKKHICIIH